MTDENSQQSADPVVLVIDDDPLVSVVVRRALEGRPHRLFTALDGRSGLSELAKRRPDLIVLDNILPDGLGVETLTRIHEAAPRVPVLFVTARGSGSTAIEAMKLSAFDYLPKPLDPAKLRTQIDRALSLSRLTAAPAAVDPVLASFDAHEAAGALSPGSAALVGDCSAMQTVFKSIGKVATQDVAVLVRGEHGTGKESVAREIHRYSHRCDGPLVRGNCHGVDEQKIDHDLFGGPSDPDGRFADARGGTLVLQEVGRLPLPLQSKLLDAIRDGRYLSASGAATRRVDCRVIAITTEDLELKSREGEFRSDLFYALSSFVIALPPVRKRHGDLPLLVDHCLRRMSPITESFGVAEPIVSEEVMQALRGHTWPGNLDELESVLKRALIEQKGNLLLAPELTASFIAHPATASSRDPDDARRTTDWATFCGLRIEAGVDTLHAEAIAEAERKLFEQVLGHTRGNQAHAARLLGITRASLRKKLRQYGMSPHGQDA